MLAGTITFKHLDSVAVIGTASQINAMATLKGVTGLYANRQLGYYLHESVPAIRADQAWSAGVTGQGIGIAVIDSGIDATHPDLTLGDETVQNVKVLASPSDVYSVSGRPGRSLYLEDQFNTDATSGHGTHVAGSAAGSGEALNGYYTGVAKDAHLVGIGVGEVIFVIWALAGFDYVLDNAHRYNITVINNSWGIARKAAEYRRLGDAWCARPAGMAAVTGVIVPCWTGQRGLRGEVRLRPMARRCCH